MKAFMLIVYLIGPYGGAHDESAIYGSREDCTAASYSLRHEPRVVAAICREASLAISYAVNGQGS